MQVLYLASTSPQGGMSEKIYRYDWSLTALGPLLQWPATLRIAVDMLLGSKFPGCLVWGPQMVTLYNDAFIPILGAKPEALGRGFDEVWAEAWDIIGPMVFRTYAGEAIFRENFPMMTDRNGAMEQTYFTFCYSPVRDESGAVAGFLDMAVETTANVESLHSWRTLANTFEHQLQARTLDRNRFWQLSTDVMLVVTHDLIISSVNPAWTQVLGWEESEMLDTPLMDLVHLDDVPNIERVVGQLLIGVTCENENSRVRHKDGHYRWFNWSATPSDESFIAVGRDTTLEREREEAIKHADQLLHDSHKVQAMGRLCGNVAHEFNSLLGGISSSLEVFERGIAQGRQDTIHDAIDVARNATERATWLTHRLLALSRCQPLAPAPVNLSALIQALTPSFQRVLGHAYSVQVQVEPAPWSVLIDVRQLEDALLNLCVNAGESMPNGGAVRISTGNDRHSAQLARAGDLSPGDYVYVQVQDEGHGMSSEVVSRAFEPFFTTKPKGLGSGLGLAMVNSFVRQSGGEVWIDSTPGAGTRVKMRLPRTIDLGPL